MNKPDFLTIKHIVDSYCLAVSKSYKFDEGYVSQNGKDVLYSLAYNRLEDLYGCDFPFFLTDIIKEFPK